MSKSPNWPEFANPLFGAIVARHVRQKQNSSGGEKLTVENLKKLDVDDNVEPDLLMLGNDDLLFPVIKKENEMDRFEYDSPFYLTGKSGLLHKKLSEKGFATGIIMLLYALDTIKLGKMPFKSMIGFQIGAKTP